MIDRRQFVLASAASAAALGTGPSVRGQELPAGYPADYKAVVEKARSEGVISIYTSTDDVQGRPIVEAFQKAFPGIRVDYNDLGTNGSYNRVISEAAAKQVGSDIVWTSAMDLQMVLVQKGLAEAYKSPETGRLPVWANFKDTLYGTTVEPVAILYNKAQLAAFKLPQTRAELLAFMRDNKDALKGKLATFDPEKSGTGFLFFSNDAKTRPDTFELVRAFGATEGKTYGSSGAMREKIVSGEHWLAFNVIGSYAIEWAAKNPALGYILTSDYTAAFSRVANISKGAPHPNAARVFLDFLIGAAGQTALASVGAPSIRTDVSSGLNLTRLGEMAKGNLKPIPVTSALLEATEPKNRADFFRRWKEALRG